jgi:quercetin dioxygenase-like cupin family protein
MFARTIRLAGAAGALFAAHAGLAQAPQKAAAAKAAALHWGPAPPTLPAGAKVAVVSGDPTKAGPFTIDLAMPSGYRIPAHFHPTAENVTVKSGTFLYGMGDKLDRKAMKAMKKGESRSMPANMHHFAQAQGKTTVEVSSTGPFMVTYVNPSDDPSKNVAQKHTAKKKG